MITSSELQSDIQQILNNGTLCRFKYFNVTYPNTGSYYDDYTTLAQSGSDLWVSGLIMPINSKDAVLLQQGQIRNDDKALYVLGTVQTSGLFQVGIGSPIESEYSLTEAGIKTWQIGNDDVYKKIFLRRLTTGSIT